ncbi:DUF4136 domain-containing protein [Hymenobacter aerophilus]|uniref:DUF4136 domain-containing protein n=1 Tax=Hymenobacter aerophilus TaxID=119644 RepID=UPI00036688FA|nr:DUF4136 domain-containing protein [Hymenobacter aerophilus]
MTIKTLLVATGVALMTFGCSESKQAVTVGSEQRGQDVAGGAGTAGALNATDEPDFSKYKTYSWASQVQDEQNNTYFLNDLVFKTMLRDAVAHEMASKGYTYQPGTGDLVVNFRVFEQPTELKTTDNLGQGYWGTTEPYSYNSQRQGEVKLDKGSILVQMIDRQKGEEIWQGYASGLTDGNVFNKDKDRIYQAVGAIFSKYNHRADKL